MDIQKSRKLILRVACAYWALVVLIYVVARPQFHQTAAVSDALSPTIVVCDLVEGTEVRQSVTVPVNRLNTVSLLAATYGRENPGTVSVALEDGAGSVLARVEADAASFENGKYTNLTLQEPVTGLRGQTVTAVVTARGCPPGEALALYAGDTVSTGRFDVIREVAEGDCVLINGQRGQGMLCLTLSGFNDITFYRTYWFITAGAFIVAAMVCLHWWREGLRGGNNPLVAVCTLFTKYSLLFRQLVSRDFKAKYKRSVLGMAWSFLNPLMTMAVQYVVFSTIFKSNIEKYPVYLLTGIVLMNFFNEAVSMGMTSITGNAALIKKVYMPKYIYPLSRVVSSSINFLLAFIPLFLSMLVTRTAIRPSILLLTFDILCLVGFITGMSLLLTTAMTFFQDTQFLWSVLSMMWMYLTPVFYPESIIPQRLLTLFHMNPMYQYITFARICIINGASPEPMAYLWCIVSSMVVLLAGILVFKRHQDKFILYL